LGLVRPPNISKTISLPVPPNLLKIPNSRGISVLTFLICGFSLSLNEYISRNGKAFTKHCQLAVKNGNENQNPV
jgi:hypothetical protein